MNKLKKLTRAARACIELEIAHPNWTTQELADGMQMHHNTVFNWQHSPVYTDERERRLKEEWKAAAKKAQNKMIEIMDTAKDEVALNAAKYVLDSTGYKPTDMIDINAGIYSYEVDYGDEG